jgi:hypothetical protein
MFIDTFDRGNPTPIGFFEMYNLYPDIVILPLFGEIKLTVVGFCRIDVPDCLAVAVP